VDSKLSTRRSLQEEEAGAEGGSSLPAEGRDKVVVEKISKDNNWTRETIRDNDDVKGGCFNIPSFL
jgi:hypothetical protein